MLKWCALSWESLSKIGCLQLQPHTTTSAFLLTCRVVVCVADSPDKWECMCAYVFYFSWLSRYISKHFIYSHIDLLNSSDITIQKWKHLSIFLLVTFFSIFFFSCSFFHAFIVTVAHIWSIVFVVFLCLPHWHTHNIQFSGKNQAIFGLNQFFTLMCQISISLFCSRDSYRFIVRIYS